MKNKTLSLTLIALLGAIGLSSCGGNSTSKVAKEIYVTSEITAVESTGYTYYDAYELKIYEDSTYEYVHTEIMYAWSMTVATVVIDNEGTYTTGTAVDGYTPINLSAATHIIFEAYSLVGSFNLDIDSDTVSYPTELMASGQGEQIYANNFSELQAAYGEAMTLYAGDSNILYLTNPAA